MESKAGCPRSRVLLRKQSKYGCVTCKQRHIKCDESWPTCQRCERSARQCAGFNRFRRWSQEPPQQFNPCLRELTPLEFVRECLPDQKRLANRACRVFAFDPHYLHCVSTSNIFSIILPQLSARCLMVNAAAAAFGGAYEATFIQDRSFDSSVRSAKHYGFAIQLLQTDLNTSKPQLIPLLISILLLAAFETVQCRYKNALCHVAGAFGLLEEYQSGEYIPPSAVKACGPDDEHLENFVDLFQHIDTHIAMFAYGQTPAFPASLSSYDDERPLTIQDVFSGQPKLLHRCLHFVAEVSRKVPNKYAHLSLELATHQAQLISRLRQWLAACRSVDLLSTDTQLLHLSVLKAQCLSMLVILSNVQALNERGYDSFVDEFREIIQCADKILNRVEKTGLEASSSGFPPFSPTPGIISTLVLTAHKCRHSEVRRRAIQLLCISGIEGPFNGLDNACEAARLVQLEEGRSFTMDIPQETVLLPKDVSDSNRIYACWRARDSRTLEYRRVFFSRQRTDQSQPPLLQEIPKRLRLDQDDKWEIWAEDIFIKLHSGFPPVSANHE